MTFQRIIVGVVILLTAALAVAFYIDWKMAVQLRTVKAFVEGYVFAEAVAACEKSPSTTPFKWNAGTRTSVIGLSSVKLDKNTVIPSYTLVADSVYCDSIRSRRKPTSDRISSSGSKLNHTLISTVIFPAPMRAIERLFKRIEALKG
jgi:hypothetical protein